MDIRFLQTFLEVAQTRHFGRAAENLYLTQSAVSARIKLLEEYFNTPLFIRQRNSIQITLAGEKLIPFAKSLTNELEEARHALAQEECAHIRCCSTQSAMSLFFAKRFADTLVEFKHLSVNHDVANNEQITRHLHEHRIDFALTTSPLKSDDIVSQVISQIELRLYTSNVNVLSTDTSAPNFIQLDWTPQLNDKIKVLYPDVRRAKLTTSSISFAISTLQKMSASAILPDANSPMLEDELKNTLQSLNAQGLCEPLSVPIYLHVLKSNKHEGIGELLGFLSK